MSNSDRLPLRVVARSQSRIKCLPTGLPFDIACAIVQQLSLIGPFDYSALRACALVCRDWTPIAQQYLFRSVAISLRVEYNRKRISPGAHLYTPKQPQRFLNLLDGSPHLARFVLHVLIHSGEGIPLTDFLRKMLLRTTRLCSLQLVNTTVAAAPSFHPGPAPQGDGRASPVPRAAIDKLDLSHCNFDGTRPIVDLLGHFSSIRRLLLRRTKILCPNDSDPRLSDLEPSTVPAIESIMLDAPEEWEEPEDDSLLALLHAVLRGSFVVAHGTGVGTGLTCIRLRMNHPAALDRFLLPCLYDARAQLRELYLDIDVRGLLQRLPRHENVSEHWAALNMRLAACTALESITFIVEGRPAQYDRGDPPYADRLRVVLGTYARFVCPPPPAVRSIVFRVKRASDKDAAVRDVLDAIANPGEHHRGYQGELDVALSRHSELKRFAFTFDLDTYGNEDGCMTEQDRARIAGALEVVLPRTAAKGFLGVELNPSPDVYWF